MENLITEFRASIAMAGVSVLTAASGWSQVPDRPLPTLPKPVAISALNNDSIDPMISAQPAALAFVPDQRPKRAEPLKTLDQPERLMAARAALDQAQSTTIAVASGTAPVLARPVLPAWAPDDLGDVSMNLDSNRAAMKAEAR